MAGRLRDIKFKSSTVNIISFDPEPRILVKWCLEPTAQDLRNLRFFVDRGESPEDMKQISAVPIKYNDVHEFVDYTGKLLNTEKIYYYRVRAVEFNQALDTPLQTFETAPFNWQGDLDLVGLYIVDEHLFAFRYVYGVPALVYKKRTEGARCSECWDVVLKRVTKSNCRTCRGTGFIDGYYKPIEAWMDFNPDPKVTSISEWGERQPSQTDVLFTNYPLMASGDIVVELEPNRYWRVSNARDTEKNRTTLLQVMRLDEINRSDIELSIAVPDDVRDRMLKEFRCREQIPEF